MCGYKYRRIKDLYVVSSNETFLQDFLEIPNHSLQNFLNKYFLISVVAYVTLINTNYILTSMAYIQPHNSVLAVSKILNWNLHKFPWIVENILQSDFINSNMNSYY